MTKKSFISLKIIIRNKLLYFHITLWGQFEIFGGDKAPFNSTHVDGKYQ